MKSLGLNIILVLAINISMFALLSCSDVADRDSVPVVFSASFDRSGETQNGGIIISGVSEDKQMFFRVDASSGNATQMLPKGNWSFYAVGWTGPSKMEGEMRCSDRIDKALVGTLENVALHISKARCANLAYNYTNGPSPHISETSVNNIEVMTCASLPTGTIANTTKCDGSNSTATKGIYNSLKIFMPLTTQPISFSDRASWIGNNDQLWWLSNVYPSSAFESGCKQFSGDSSTGGLPFKIPINTAVDFIYGATPMIIAYENADCSSTEHEVFDFGNKFGTEITTLTKSVNSTTTKVFIKDKNNDYCNHTRTVNSPFANSGETNSASETFDGSSIDRAHTICSAAQWNAIETNTTKYYILMNDINFNNNAYTPIGSSGNEFKGIILGNSHTLSNINISGTSNLGLFGSTLDASISSLKIDGCNIHIGNASLVQNIGCLVGLSIGGVNITDVYVNGTIDGLYNGTTGIYSSIGGLFGQVNSTTSSNTTISRVGFSGLIKLDLTSASSISVSSVGGIAGNIENPDGGTTSLTDAYAHADIEITGNPVTASIGGIAGKLMNGVVNVNKTSFLGTVKINTGTTNIAYIGGIVGYNNDAPITDSFSVGTIETASTGTISQVGGIIGYISSTVVTPISNTYFSGSINLSSTTTIDCAGGIVGKSEVSMNTTFSNSFSSASFNCSGGGSVTNIGQGGGLINSTPPSNLYYDNETTSTGMCATPLTTYTTGSVSSSFYNNKVNLLVPPLGWDFTTIWQAIPGSFPVLRK